MPDPVMNEALNLQSRWQESLDRKERIISDLKQERLTQLEIAEKLFGLLPRLIERL